MIFAINLCLFQCSHIILCALVSMTSASSSGTGNSIDSSNILYYNFNY